MKSRMEHPFETIESAHDFMALFAEAVSQAKEELQLDVDRETDSPEASRRLDALRMALYNVEKLEHHLNRSSRILNDLRILRRLLFEERSALANASTSSGVGAKEKTAA